MLTSDLYQGDCLELLSKIPDKSINMILCDLPYGTTRNKWDSVIPLDKLWIEYKRILAPKGAIALTSQGIFTAQLIMSNPEWFKYKLVWHKSKPVNFLNANKQPLRSHEDICIFYPKQPKYFPQKSKGKPYNHGVRTNRLTDSYGKFNPILQVNETGDRYPTDVVKFNAAESEGKVYHSTQKPVALGRYLIKTYTEPGDTILDNTFGSGSFLVAAAIEGRNVIGIELNDNFVSIRHGKLDLLKVASERIEKESGIKSTLHYGDKIILDEEPKV